MKNKPLLKFRSLGKHGMKCVTLQSLSPSFILLFNFLADGVKITFKELRVDWGRFSFKMAGKHYLHCQLKASLEAR